ncbi:MAG: hypothetical protein DMF85_01815, partial [Acidobacteria bacterium]
MRPQRLRIAIGAALAGLAVQAAGAAGPEIVLQSKHPKFLASATFFDHGRRIATAGDAINVWDVQTRLKVRTIRPSRGGAPTEIAAIVADPDGRLLIAGDRNAGVLYVYDAVDGSLKQTVDRVGVAVSDLDVSSDGTTLSVAGYEQVAWFHLDVRAPQPLSQPRTMALPGREIIWRARFLDPKGARIVAADSSRLTIVQTDAARVVRTIPAHRKMLQSLAVTPDGATLATSGTDEESGIGAYTVRLWNAGTGRQIREIDVKESYVKDLAFSPDGRILAVAGQIAERRLSLYSVATGQFLRTCPGHLGEEVAVRFDPDGRLLVSLSNGNTDHRVLLHDVATGRQVAEMGYGIETVRALAVRPGGGAVAIASDHAAYVLDLGRGLRRQPLRVPNMSWIQAVAWSADARQVFASEGIFGREPNHVFDAASGALLTDLAPLPGDKQLYANEIAELAAYHPDGMRIALGMRDGRVEIRRLTDHSLLRVLPPLSGVQRGLAAPVVGLLFTTDGTRLYVAASEPSTSDVHGSLRLFDLESGALIAELVSNARMGPIALAPDARFATGGLTSDLKIYERETGKPVVVCEPRREWTVASLTFSADGRYLFAGRQSGVVMTWDARTGAFVREQSLHDDWVEALAADPATGLILSGSKDGTLKIQSAAPDGTLTPRVTIVSVGPEDYVAITADGYYRTSAGGARGVGYRVNDAVFPFEQFDLRYNRPDRVLAALASADSSLVEALASAYRRRLRRLGLDEPAIHALETATGAPALENLPMLTIDGGRLPPVTADRSVALQISAKAPPGSTLSRIRLFVDDVPAAVSLDGAAAQTAEAPDGLAIQGTTFSGRVRVPLTTRYGGRNQITVSAIDALGRESPIARIEITCTAEPERPPATYVVALGVSQYRDRRFDLQYADADAASIANLFASAPARPSGSPSVQTLVLKNADVTRDALERVRGFLSRAGIDDTVVLFAAGHGLLDADGEYWFATYDTDFAAPAAKGIAYEDFESVLSSVRAREKLLLLDTCHAGESDRPEALGAVAPAPPQPGVTARSVQIVPQAAPGAGNVTAVVEELFTNLSRGSGAQVIAAAAGAEFAFERSGHGVFTA